MPPVRDSSRLYLAWSIATADSLPGERVVEGLGGLGPDHEDLGHVREVEESGGGAHRVVLGEVARVAHRHLPAGEVGERGAGRLVGVVQR